MNLEEGKQRRAEAAASLEQHEQRGDGLRVTNSLADGLSLLRELFFTRVHLDVENAFGMDSMLMPVSVIKSEANTKNEIELYLIAESITQIRSRRYVADDGWYLQWLGGLRLGEGLNGSGVMQRLDYYLSKTPDDRRRAFSLVLERSFPEARGAPLIVYRLLPLAIDIVTSLAFGDHVRAEESRKRQTTWLPNITDCNLCHGRLLENGEKCLQCGNPFWHFDWLTAE